MLQLRLTRAVKALCIAFLALFVYDKLIDPYMGQHVISWLGLVPAGFALQMRFWQILTYPFLHHDVLHLFLNMMMLVFIGSELEGSWGTKRFLKYFFFCSAFSGAIYLTLQLIVWRDLGLYQPMIGASAGIYGLLVAYGILYGERVLLFMMLFPMKAKHFVWVLAGMEFLAGISSGANGLSSVAHLAGMLGGFGYLWVKAMWVLRQRRHQTLNDLKSKLGFSSKKSSHSKHLKLVVDNDSTDPEDSSKNSSNPKTWH